MTDGTANTIDYTETIPEDEKDPLDYHYTERRAEILQFIERAGTPKRLNTKQLAERYGVTRRQIYLDYDRLADHVEASLGKRAKMRTQALYEKVVDELIEKEEYREAWRTTIEWNEWLADRGAIERAASKHEVDATIREASDESDDYELVADDATVEVDSTADAETDGKEVE